MINIIAFQINGGHVSYYRKQPSKAVTLLRNSLWDSHTGVWTNKLPLGDTDFLLFPSLSWPCLHLHLILAKSLSDNLTLTFNQNPQGVMGWKFFYTMSLSHVQPAVAFYDEEPKVVLSFFAVLPGVMSARLNKRNLNTIINREQNKILGTKLISHRPRIDTAPRRYL